jgi:hypothetical protein
LCIPFAALWLHTLRPNLNRHFPQLELELYHFTKRGLEAPTYAYLAVGSQLTDRNARAEHYGHNEDHQADILD